MSVRLNDLIGLWKVDLAPLRHITAESMREKATLHRIILIVWLYDFLYFAEIRLASLLKVTWAEGPHPPIVDRTRGVKEPYSTSMIRLSYSLRFSFSCLL